ncbi:hypothetical protein Prudu_006394 [Prunus dulcis]|uniref:Uncharacterized protein n=1 Tax=Prunus dulcis TaxID=3755 RepID=A0A4Y1QZS1_PRUDU|nr:hypothetical protein Prudu_006394 [Prunus dulcis]
MSRRRRKETTQAIILAPAPPTEAEDLVEDFGYGQNTGETLPNFRQKSEENLKEEIEKGKGKIDIRARHSPDVGHAQDSARFPKQKLGRNPPLEPENLPTPEPAQEPVEQPFIGGPSGPAPPRPTVMGDPNLQQTLELLTQALSRAEQSRDPSLGYADQAKRIGATDFDGDGDPAVAEEWIEKWNGSWR